MPTDLERRLLSNLIEGLDAKDLRKVIMHVAEHHLEMIVVESLRIKKEQRSMGMGTGQASTSTSTSMSMSVAPAIPVPTTHRRLSVSVSPAIESDLESHTRTEEELEEDTEYLPPPTTNPAARPRTTLFIEPPSRPTSHSIKLQKLLRGLRTPSQRKSLTRIAGIIDTFPWATGTRNDFFKCYIGDNEYLPSGWPAIVNAHGKRLRRYSEGFRAMYPPKKFNTRKEAGESLRVKEEA